MNNLQSAIALDEKRNFVDASEAYEKIISSGEAPVEAFVNLAVLYWVAVYPGTIWDFNLPSDFVQKAGIRILDVLSEAECKYPGNPDVRFWDIYIKFISYSGEELFEESKQLLNHPDCSLDPYFTLFTYADGLKYDNEAQLLLKQYEEHPTEKNRYIWGVIQGVIEDREYRRKKESGELKTY